MKNLFVLSKQVWLGIFLSLVLPVMAFAGGGSCATATAVIPDGRSLDLDYVAPSSTVWYQFNATANRSYSVEVRDDLDPDNADFSGNILFYAPPSTCASPTSNTNYTDTHLTEPAAGPHAVRFSFTATATGAYYVSVLNGNASTGHYVTVTVTETTLYHTGWSTYASLTTYFGFQNTTSQCINFTLTLVSVIPSQTSTLTASVGASCTTPVPMVAVNTAPSSSNTPPQSYGLGVTNQAGYAILTHNGPPGSIQATAESANFGTAPFSVIPLSWAPMHGK